MQQVVGVVVVVWIFYLFFKNKLELFQEIFTKKVNFFMYGLKNLFLNKDLKIKNNKLTIKNNKLIIKNNKLSDILMLLQMFLLIYRPKLCILDKGKHSF